MSNRGQEPQEQPAEAYQGTVGTTRYSGQAVGANQGATVSINATDTARLDAHEEAAAHTLDLYLLNINQMREKMQGDKREIERLKASTRATLARLRAA
ncbi:MAG: hypothetical protein M3R24_03435 [Chloroflexota bacterium]|nr:hypothetical protein [Chloroflexota bacterium]